MNHFDNMRKLKFDLLVIGVLILMIPLATKAQLFETNELYPNTNVIKGKYYSGTGGGGYWSLEYVDSMGRIVSKESYHKKQLMSRRKIVYDNNNNKNFDIQTFDYNNPERVDTFRYEYKYADNRIIYQSHHILAIKAIPERESLEYKISPEKRLFGIKIISSYNTFMPSHNS